MGDAPAVPDRQQPRARSALLPALPEAWSNGHVTGLRARGGYELDLAWTRDVLDQAVLRGVVVDPPPVAVRYRGTTISLSLAKGDALTLDASDFGT